MSSRTRQMSAAALGAALLAVSAWFTIPLGSVPVTLQVFVLVVIALLFSPGWATASVCVYVLAGAAGLPVFSGGRGGFAVLTGPTGGYIVGFAFGVLAASFVRYALARHGTLLSDGSAIVALLAVVYGLGWLQLMIVTGMGPKEAFLAGVAPFIFVDIAKSFVGAGVAAAVRRAGWAQVVSDPDAIMDA
ncbi:MAG: biotin transporter BioY [Coriobacteriia bacterium]